MTKKILSIILLCSFILFIIFCGSENKSEKVNIDQKDNHSSTTEELTLTEGEKKQISLKTTIVKPGPVKSTLKVMGKILTPNHKKAIVGFTFSARINQINVNIGEWVKKGQPLLTLECEEVGNAQSEFVKALTDFKLAKLDMQREKRLFDKDIGAKKDYLEVKAKYEIAQAGLKAAEKKLVVLGLTKEQIKTISKTKDVSPYVTVKAPLSGKVVINNAIIGAVIESSTEIMVIMNLDYLWIDAEIYEKDLSKVKLEQTVEIRIPAYPQEIFKGIIHYIGDIVNPDTRTIKVRTKVINLNSRLKPGMFADINIMTGSKDRAIVVKKEAVLDDGDKNIVFIEKGNSYILRYVVVGIRHNGDFEILKGLKIGDVVVTEGNYQLMSKLHEESLSHTH